jgi:hypothetical protein
MSHELLQVPELDVTLPVLLELVDVVGRRVGKHRPQQALDPS